MKPEICRAMTANKYTKKCDDMDAYNSLIPYLGKQISMLLIESKKKKQAWFLTNKEKLDTSGL